MNFTACLSVPATSIAPKLSSSSPSDTNETVVVPEDAANAVFKFADESLRLTVDAGAVTNISLFCAIVDLLCSCQWVSLQGF